MKKQCIKLILLICSIMPVANVHAVDDHIYSCEDFESALAWVFSRNTDPAEQLEKIVDNSLDTSLFEDVVLEDISQYAIQPRVVGENCIIDPSKLPFSSYMTLKNVGRALVLAGGVYVTYQAWKLLKKKITYFNNECEALQGAIQKRSKHVKELTASSAFLKDSIEQNKQNIESLQENLQSSQATLASYNHELEGLMLALQNVLPEKTKNLSTIIPKTKEMLEEATKAYSDINTQVQVLSNNIAELNRTSTTEKLNNQNIATLTQCEASIGESIRQCTQNLEGLETKKESIRKAFQSIFMMLGLGTNENAAFLQDVAKNIIAQAPRYYSENYGLVNSRNLYSQNSSQSAHFGRINSVWNIRSLESGNSDIDVD